MPGNAASYIAARPCGRASDFAFLSDSVTVFNATMPDEPSHINHAPAPAIPLYTW